MPQLPPSFLKSLQNLPGFNEKTFVEVHNKETRVTSIQLNPFKRVELDFELSAPVSWSSRGFYIDERPSFTHDPLFHAGCYYVQEAGSMFIELALKQTLNFEGSLKILDACAAPGGKSTLANSLLNENSLLVANEIIKSRADILVQNLGKWGTANSIITNNEPGRFANLTSFFDAIILDAPCSGSGLFRKQPEAINEWSADHVRACSIRQQGILRAVLPSLKENGILVYSTCSYSAEENEDVVLKLIKEGEMEYVPLEINADWGIIESDLGYRFYPNHVKSEGFFCAVLRKKNGKESSYFSKKKLAEVSKNERAILNTVAVTEDMVILKKNDQFHLMNKTVGNFLNIFEKQFYFKKAGVTVGEIKGTDIVPNQELAWFSGVNEKTSRLDLTKESALKFLKKENFETEINVKGLVLVCYKGQGLGWAKILPNRINNYLPNELRILK
jgi:16S rRNA C967 or C1407 C5-methylase (RsmB/RsmF family)/NOL1/NOP2/fmu family ribosome biogenesis protein